MNPSRIFKSILHSAGTSLALGMIAYGQAPSPSSTPEIRAAHPRPDGGLAVEISGWTDPSAVALERAKAEGPAAVFDLRREWPLEAEDDDSADLAAREDVDAPDSAGPMILFSRSGPEIRPGPYLLELRRVRDGLPERQPAAVRPVWIGSLDAWIEAWETERKSVRALLAAWKGDGGDADAAALAGFAPARFFSVAAELAVLHDATERRIVRELFRNRAPAGSSPDSSPDLSAEAPAGAKAEAPAGAKGEAPDLSAVVPRTKAEGTGGPPPEKSETPSPARDRFVRETLGWVLLAAERAAEGRLCVFGSSAPAADRLRDLSSSSAASAFTEWPRLAALARELLRTEPDLRDSAAASGFTALWEKFPAPAGAETSTTDWPAAAALAREIRLRLKKGS